MDVRFFIEAPCVSVGTVTMATVAYSQHTFTLFLAMTEVGVTRNKRFA